jgi:hypothetical protein
MKKIRIAGLDYKIEELKYILYDSDGKEVDGRAYIDRQKIQLSFCKCAGKDYKNLLLIHEITHLLFYYAGTGNSKLWKNENDVHNFSVLLHQVLRDNNLLKLV